MAESKDVVEVREDGLSRTVVFEHSVDGEVVSSTYVEYDATAEGLELAVGDVGDERVLHLYNMQARIEARNKTASSHRTKADSVYAAEQAWAVANQPDELAAAKAGTYQQLGNYLKQVRRVMKRKADAEKEENE